MMLTLYFLMSSLISFLKVSRNSWYSTRFPLLLQSSFICPLQSYVFCFITMWLFSAAYLLTYDFLFCFKHCFLWFVIQALCSFSQSLKPHLELETEFSHHCGDMFCCLACEAWHLYCFLKSLKCTCCCICIIFKILKAVRTQFFFSPKKPCHYILNAKQVICSDVWRHWQK